MDIVLPDTGDDLEFEVLAPLPRRSVAPRRYCAIAPEGCIRDRLMRKKLVSLCSDSTVRLPPMACMIARLDNPSLKAGELWLDHQPLHEMKAYQAAQCGIGLVPEDRRIIQGLTVEENLKLAQIAPPIGWSIARIYDLFPRLGEQQMLSIGRTLARDIKLLLLDEPYEGLAPVIVQEIERTLEQIKSLGITTIIVEQNAVAAFHLADRAASQTGTC